MACKQKSANHCARRALHRMAAALLRRSAWIGQPSTWHDRASHERNSNNDGQYGEHTQESNKAAILATAMNNKKVGQSAQASE
jgi:hypothetical protein